MKKYIGRFLTSGLFAFGFLVGPSHALTLSEFTGDSISAEVTLTNLGDGVEFNVSLMEAGNITGIWLGVDDSVFDPSVIHASDISLVGPNGYQFDVLFGVGDALYSGGANLNGESGYALAFDFDLAVIGDNKEGVKYDSLTLEIATAGLEASFFNAVGIRVQSVGLDGEGSSKMAAWVVPVSEIPVPASLQLLIMALFILGLGRYGIYRRFREYIRPEPV